MASIPARPISAVREEPRSFPHVGFIAVEVVLLAALAALAFAVKHHPGPLAGDVGLELDVQHALLPHRMLASALEAVSTLNWPIPAAVTLAIIVAILLVLRRWLDSLIVVATAAVSDGTNALISQFIHRPRPGGHGIHVLSLIHGTYSFPSGHVLYATAVFGLFLFLTWQVRHAFHPAIVWLVRLIAFAVIVLMPFSRMLEGEHWPTDCLAGFLYGAFWLILAAHLYLWARSRWPRLLARDER